MPERRGRPRRLDRAGVPRGPQQTARAGMMVVMAEASVVAIRGDSIRLGQFLKLSDAIDQGSDARALLASEAVTVNGEVETRRGRQLVPGDVVEVLHHSYVVSNTE